MMAKHHKNKTHLNRRLKIAEVNITLSRTHSGPSYEPPPSPTVTQALDLANFPPIIPISSPLKNLAILDILPDLESFGNLAPLSANLIQPHGKDVAFAYAMQSFYYR